MLIAGCEGLIEKWRLARRKLGLGPCRLGEWHLMMEVRDLASWRMPSSAWPAAPSPWKACTTA
jgi:hypothetical protein